MNTASSECTNIGRRQRRGRAAFGLVCLGVALAVVAVAEQGRTRWAILLLVLLVTGTISLLESRRGVCVVVAARPGQDGVDGASDGPRNDVRGKAIGRRAWRIALEGTGIGLVAWLALLFAPV